MNLFFMIKKDNNKDIISYLIKIYKYYKYIYL